MPTEIKILASAAEGAIRSAPANSAVPIVFLRRRVVIIIYPVLRALRLPGGAVATAGCENDGDCDSSLTWFVSS